MNLRNDFFQKKLPSAGVIDSDVVRALRKVSREHFLPENMRKNAYLDMALPIKEDQTISQPSLVGLMTQALHLNSKSKVLEIGTGSGYQTALLAELCAQVYTVEIRRNLIKQAQKTLDRLGYTHIEYKVGDGTKGWKEKAPFDCIIVTAANTEIPEILIHQLKPHGKMVIPIKTQDKQWLYLLQKEGNDYSYKLSQICEVRFVPIVSQDPLYPSSD